MSAPRYIVGIDLGTTNTAVAYVDTAEDAPRIQPFPILQIVAPGAFTPPDGAPDFFRFGKSGAIERALKTAGFRDVRSKHMTIEWVFADANDFWNSMKQGPSLKRALVGLSPALRRTIKEEVARRLECFRRRNALRIPNEAVLAVGRKR